MAEFPRHPFLLSIAETAQALGTDIERGLTSRQVVDLQAKYPPNELDVGGTVPWYKILTKQILNAMILVRHTSAPFSLLSSPPVSFCIEDGPCILLFSTA